MIAILSHVVTVYLAPVLSLTAVFLTLFSYLSPVVMLHSQVSLLAVRPSRVLTTNNTGTVDGPTVLLGVLGSCSRSNNQAPFICTSPSLNPTYNLSVLPKNAPNLLSAPTSTTPVFIAISVSFSIMFFLLFTLTAFRSKLGGKISDMLERPLIQKVTAWVGFLGFMIGLTSFLIVRMWFGKAVQDFNNAVQLQTTSAPSLVSQISNGFIMVWVGYAFYAVPLVFAMAKVHATAGPPVGKA